MMINNYDSQVPHKISVSFLKINKSNYFLSYSLESLINLEYGLNAEVSHALWVKHYEFLHLAGTPNIDKNSFSTHFPITQFLSKQSLKWLIVMLG